MASATRDNPRWPKWVVWAVFLLTVPVPFFLVVAIGLVPLSYILFLAVQGLIVGLQKFTADGFWMLGLFWAQVLILGGLLYAIASGITRLLFRFLPHRVALSVVFALIAALFAASAFEMYRLPHHNLQKPANLFRVIRDVSPFRRLHPGPERLSRSNAPDLFRPDRSSRPVGRLRGHFAPRNPFQ